jgi:hypothetical protein
MAGAGGGGEAALQVNPAGNRRYLISTRFQTRCLFKSNVQLGCQIFLGTTNPNGKKLPNGQKIYHMAINVPNGSEIDQMVAKTTNIRHSEIYPSWDFWFENMSSGDPCVQHWKINVTKKRKEKLRTNKIVSNVHSRNSWHVLRFLAESLKKIAFLLASE